MQLSRNPGVPKTFFYGGNSLRQWGDLLFYQAASSSAKWVLKKRVTSRRRYRSAAASRSSRSASISPHEFFLTPKLRVELLGLFREGAPVGVNDHRRVRDG